MPVHRVDAMTMLAGDSAELRKARGAFFTPPALCAYVVDWAVRDGSEDVLEPSCGEAAFLLATAARLDLLGVDRGGTLAGVELHEASAAHARALVAATGRQAEIMPGDFFGITPERRYDAVIGNPPYVRYQDFSGEERARSQRAALAAGVPLTGLASSWAAFTVHAARFLRDGGRLGLVLPAELLHVNYASEVRRFLVERFATVKLVLFTERVFPGVQEEVVLLLAEGYNGTPGGFCELHEVRNAEDLAASTAAVRRWTPMPAEGKWTPSLLPGPAVGPYLQLQASGIFTPLESWGDTTLGMVSGNNRYFAISPARARELGLSADELLPLSPPGSRHLRGMTFSTAAWRDLGAQGAATYLFRPPLGELSPAARAYVEAGEALDVHKAYKCRVRKPWWRVPLQRPADLLLTYMNADTPRLCSNAAKAHHLNSVHGVYLRPGLKKLGTDLLPLAALSSMTLLGAETVGRSYGGGMLKLEPREADLLPVPSPAVIAAARPQLVAVRPQLARATRAGKLLDAAKIVDDVLLVGALGMARAEVKALREAHGELSARRLARAKA